jgi:sulfite oxidase
MMNTRRVFFQTLAGAALVSRAAEVQKRDMIVRSARPADLEMPLDGFGDWITPLDRFFVRCHHYTPNVDLAGWNLTVAGEVAKTLTLTMDDLKKMPRVELVGVLECAGNGRALYEPPVPGAQWVHGGVGNGRWAGVRLADVLAKAGVKASGKNVLMDGADEAIGTMPKFQRQLPLTKALNRDTLLAYEMNGETLPQQHGFPLRVVAAGWAGDSWTKWLTKLTVIDRDADGFWMKTGYRHPLYPVTPGTAVDPAKMHPVEALGIKTVIAGPAEDTQVMPGKPLKIHGTAWSGETPVASVEVSVDRGRTWRKAALNPEQSRYGWRLWQYSWTPEQQGFYFLMARAYDMAGKTQPMEQEWNPSGYLHNVVPRVAVTVTETPEKPQPAGGSSGANPQFAPPAGFQTACLTCHGEDMIMQERLTGKQWNAEVDKMVRWGAQVKAEDRGAIVDYLLKLYGPRPLK